MGRGQNRARGWGGCCVLSRPNRYTFRSLPALWEGLRPHPALQERLPMLREGLPIPPTHLKGSLDPTRPLPAFEVGILTLPGPPGGHPNPSRPTGRASRPLSALLEGLPTPPSPPGGPPDRSRPFGRAFRPLPALRKGIPTHPGPPRGPSDPTRSSETASRSLPALREGIPTPPNPSWHSGRAFQSLPGPRMGARPLPAPPDPSWPLPSAPNHSTLTKNA